eukprot:COSAG01_NODE_3806_length_5679_cov_56.227061_3_plen_101_part_00
MMARATTSCLALIQASVVCQLKIAFLDGTWQSQEVVGSMLNQGGHRGVEGVVAVVKVARKAPYSHLVVVPPTELSTLCGAVDPQSTVLCVIIGLLRLVCE